MEDWNLNPFWRKEKPSEAEKKVKELYDGAKMPDIDRSYLHEPTSKSPNGRFVLEWFDGYQLRYGSRESGDGQYSLMEDGKRILKGTMQRPNDGHVANDGSFVLCDWMFGEGLKGTLYAIDKAGTILLKKSFDANLLNCAISTDGRYVVCQTAYSKSEDNHKLSLFDLTDGARLFCVEPPEERWAEGYEIAPSENKVYLIYKDFGRYAYSFSGEFLDKGEWLEENIKIADGIQLAQIARRLWAECKGEMPSEKTQRAIALMEEALRRGMLKKPVEMAKIYRDIGEAYESLNQSEKALDNYKKSLSIDPKAGVRRKIEKLTKDI